MHQIIEAGLELTKQNLGYSYGSAEPTDGGMDCSGFIYYVLRQNGFFDVPRDSSQQYVWVRKAGNFNAVLSRHEDSFEFDALKPGDLLFWRGTYSIDRDPPVTHTMIYLGREKRTKKRVMVGASDGRTYDGKQRFGVSVFDFKLPPPPTSADAKLSPVFVGYGRIPGLIEDCTLLLVLGLHRTWGCFHLWCGRSANVNAMDTALILHECANCQGENHDEDDALFVFRELENSEQSFHFLA